MLYQLASKNINQVGQWSYDDEGASYKSIKTKQMLYCFQKQKAPTSTSHFPFHGLQWPILMSVYVYTNKQKHRMRSSQSYKIEACLSINLLSHQYFSAYIKMIRTLC